MTALRFQTRQDHTDILSLPLKDLGKSKPIFSHDTLAHDDRCTTTPSLVTKGQVNKMRTQGQTCPRHTRKSNNFNIDPLPLTSLLGVKHTQNLWTQQEHPPDMDKRMHADNIMITTGAEQTCGVKAVQGNSCKKVPVSQCQRSCSPHQSSVAHGI